MFDIEGCAINALPILAFLLWVQETEGVFCAGCFIGARGDQTCGEWRHSGRVSLTCKNTGCCIGQGARQIRVLFQPQYTRVQSELLGTLGESLCDTTLIICICHWLIPICFLSIADIMEYYFGNFSYLRWSTILMSAAQEKSFLNGMKA